ncbi:hypothetical protein ACFPYJ_10040 [Paenibacillus solisilvae]|uniref:PRTase-CE domain-containing protein n=1 Tax=Paenibacillus solisilvae TaxID=2486751 RepID=A0ABW0VUA7_9BACL
MGDNSKSIMENNEIDEIVKKWDLDEVQRNEKLEILKIWKTKLAKDDFETILKICCNFNYYSVRLTAEAYLEVFNRNASEIGEMFDSFLKESLFLPLRRKDRIESAVDMFSSFRLVNKIDANKTHVNGPADYLQKYKASIEHNSKIVREYDQENGKEEASMQSLKNELVACSNNKKQKSIKIRIREIEASKNKREQQIENFYQNYLSVKNLIIIDDFIGTGTSVKNLLEDIAKIITGSKIKIKLFLWVIEASKSGIETIVKRAKELKIEINISFYIESIDVLAENSIFSSDKIIEVKAVIKKINVQHGLKRSIYCKNHAIASFVNAPNNNLTLLSEGNSAWTALFLRTKRNKDERVMSSIELKDTYQFLRE